MYIYNGEILYENIKTICELKNTTITALEREVGLSVPSISKWKDGNPTIQKILLVANSLNVSIEYLLTSDIHATRDMVSMFLESIYNETNSRKLIWEKNSVSAKARIESSPFVSNELLYMADTQYDYDITVYTTTIGEKEIYCYNLNIADDYTSEEVHIYHDSYHVCIDHEGILEHIDSTILSKKLHDKLTDITYYEPRRKSLNQFMSDFVSKK